MAKYYTYGVYMDHGRKNITMDSKSRIVNVGESVGQSEDSRSVGRKI